MIDSSSGVESKFPSSFYHFLKFSKCRKPLLGPWSNRSNRLLQLKWWYSFNLINLSTNLSLKKTNEKSCSDMVQCNLFYVFFKVSYIKAVDWYLIVSFLFVFAVLIEYTFVLYLTDRDKQFQKHEKRKKSRKKAAKSHKCNRVCILKLFIAILKTFIALSGYIIRLLNTSFYAVGPLCCKYHFL